jgi:hypothetical protein
VALAAWAGVISGFQYLLIVFLFLIELAVDVDVDVDKSRASDGELT